MSEHKIEGAATENDEPQQNEDVEDNITAKEGDLEDKKEVKDDGQEVEAQLEREVKKSDSEEDDETSEDEEEGTADDKEPAPEDEGEVAKSIDEEAKEIPSESGKEEQESGEEDQESVVSEEKQPSVESIKEPSEVHMTVGDRQTLIDKYKTLMDERTELNLRNLIYNRKGAEYFKRKKIAPTPKEDIPDMEVYERNYVKSIYAYEESQKKLDEEQIKVDIEIGKFQKIYDKKNVKFFNSFENYQQNEKEAAKKLVFSANGKKVPIEEINKSLARQLGKIHELIDMRLKFILIRNSLQKLEKALHDVELLDEGFKVKDFEVLQEANEAYMVKLEEREATHLRQTQLCATYIEMLAHMKEQMSSDVKKCNDAQGNLNNMESDYGYARFERQAAIAHFRKLESQFHKHSESMGLKSYPKLYADFKNTRRQIAKLQTELAVMEEELKKSKMKNMKHKRPTSVLDKHCIPLKNLRPRPKLHQSVFLPQ